MDPSKPREPEATTPPEPEEEGEEHPRDEAEKKRKPNPPYTTKHGITAPKFGSAGSGGAEVEPGPERP